MANWLKNNGRKILLVSAVLLCLFSIYWLFTHSRLSMQVSGASGGEIVYSFRNTESGEAKELKSTQKSVSTWVKRGSYEVSATGRDGNFIEFIPSTPLFFTAQLIRGELKPERLRTFVGDAVKPCAGMSGTILVSGGCESVYGKLSVHMPATDTSPTYILDNPDRTIFGKNQNLITAGRVPTQIIKSASTFKEGSEGSATDPSKYISIIFAAKNSKSKNVELKELGGTEQYNFKALDSGSFMASKSNPESFIVYDSSSNKIGEFHLENAKSQNLGFTSVDFLSPSAYASLYSSPADTGGKDAVSELVVTKDSNTTHYTFKGKLYSDLKLCGSNKVCLLGGKSGMDIYDISSNEAKLDYTVYGVSSLTRSNGGQILATNDKGVMNIDIDSKKGYMEYSLGNYLFNEINVHPNGYVLRLADDKGRVMGLYVDQSAVNTDSIDKKRLELQKLPDVNFVSVYKNFIYIAGNLGDPVYDDATDGYIYNPESQKEVAEKINAEIDRLGIDRSKYTITSNAF